MKYFVMHQGQQLGPFTLEELLNDSRVNSDSFVWTDGMSDWEQIKNVPDLNYQFSTHGEATQIAGGMPPVAPPFNAQTSQTPPQYGYQNTGYQQQTPQNVDNGCPENHLTQAILVTIFCCLPFGIPAIVYAAQVQAKYNRGDFEGAEYSSERAKHFINLGFWIGLVIGIIYIAFYALVIFGELR